MSDGEHRKLVFFNDPENGVEGLLNFMSLEEILSALLRLRAINETKGEEKMRRPDVLAIDVADMNDVLFQWLVDRFDGVDDEAVDVVEACRASTYRVAKIADQFVEATLRSQEGDDE